MFSYARILGTLFCISISLQELHEEVLQPQYPIDGYFLTIQHSYQDKMIIHEKAFFIATLIFLFSTTTHIINQR